MRLHLALFVLLCCLVGAGPVLAQTGAVSAFALARLEPSARGAALGGSVAALPGEDAHALFYNPALLTPAHHGALSLSYLNHLADLNAGFAAYARHVDGVGTVAGGLRFLSYGTLEAADAEGTAGGTFAASEAILTLGLARAYTERVHLGGSVHLAHVGVGDYGATALAADLGALYHLPGPQLSLSASVSHLGLTLSSLGETTDALPLDVRVGLTKRLTHLPLLLSVTGYDLQDAGRLAPEGGALDRMMQHVALGGEFQFGPSFNVRVGYNHRRHEAFKTRSRLDLAGLGVGFGLKVRRATFDYAYHTWSSVGALHYLTFGTRL